MVNLFNYTPHKSHTIRLGELTLGGGAPLRLQSMTTCPTTDTEGCVEQCIRIIEAGADIVRLTTQGTREAENLRHIKDALRQRGYQTPLVADVHFNPNVADVAATIVEKVRINPGNYIDPPAPSRPLNTPTRNMPPNSSASKSASPVSSTSAASTARPSASG